MSFDGKGARIIFIAVIWGRRRFIYRFGFASEGNEGPIRRRYGNLSRAWKFGNRVNTCILEGGSTGMQAQKPNTWHGSSWLRRYGELIREEGLVVRDGIHGLNQAGNAFAFRDISARS